MSKQQVTVEFTTGDGESKLPLVIITKPGGHPFTESELSAFKGAASLVEVRALPEVYDTALVWRFGEIRAVSASGVSAETFYRAIEVTLAKYFDFEPRP